MPFIIIVLIVTALFFLKKKQEFKEPKILLNNIRNISVKGNTVSGILSIIVQNNNNYTITVNEGKLLSYIKGYRTGIFDINDVYKIPANGEREITIPVNLNISTSVISILNALSEKKLTIDIDGYIRANGIKFPVKDSVQVV